MNVTRRTWIPAHVRRMPARPDAYAAVHAELAAAFDQERRIEAAVAVMVREIELALDHDLQEFRRVA